MLIYKFLSAEYGLEALRSRRIKVSRISELNDPFELLAPNLSNSALRNAFHKMKSHLSMGTGLLCFSKMRTNPLLWSHYANRHQGICLGFHAPEENLHEVKYTSRRPDPADLFSESESVKEKSMQKFIATKYSHRRYENEWRLWVQLQEKDKKTGHYFLEFSDSLKLAKVVVGAESSVSRKKIDAAIGMHHPNIECFKARAAFGSFRIVRNTDEMLWE